MMTKYTINCISLACSLLAMSHVYGESCKTHLQSGNTYRNWHEGPALAFTGKITIKGTYNCPEGTCFKAEMAFDNSNGDVDRVTGFWSGSHLELIRFVAASDANQVWKGECLKNSVKGNWYFRENEGDNGKFSITY